MKKVESCCDERGHSYEISEGCVEFEDVFDLDPKWILKLFSLESRKVILKGLPPGTFTKVVVSE
jgi:hypothetical protein